MEADVFPFAAGLVTRPYTCIALSSCPSVQWDDKRTCVVAIIRHDFTHIGHAVQAEWIACAYPCNICFQNTHTGVSYFFHDITLKQCTDSFFGMEVGLCPKPDFHSVLAGIVTQFFQVLDIAVQCFGLSISGSVTVIREQPAQRHIMVLITVYHSTCRELVIVFFTVQRFLDTAIVLLAFLITFSIFKQDSLFVLFPIVAVVCIQVSLIEAELG